MLDHALGLGVDDAHEHGNAMVDDAHGLAHHLVAALVGREDHLARGAKEEQAVDARVDHVVNEALKRRNVKLVVGSVGNDDGRDDAADLEVSHGAFLSTIHG